MSALFRRWRYVPRRSAHLPDPAPLLAVDPWERTAVTMVMPAIGAHS